LRRGINTLLALNKVDQVDDKRLLLPLIERYTQLFPFLETLPVSARTGDGLGGLKETVIRHLPEGPALFPADHLTDQPLRFMAAEAIREAILRGVREEVPHASAILIDTWEERRQLVKITATIYVERAGQKTILIGRKGEMLKKIGSEARERIERLVGRKVFLGLLIKVKPKWRDDPSFLSAVDWRSMIGSEDGDS
jgi:GTP-binding protein Era